jgi:hypothetical protein
MKTLTETLSYRHPGVIRRFAREHPELAAEAEHVFEDLLRFFWASRRHELDRREAPEREELNFAYIMDEEMRPIDQMWHIFLLYTKDYAEFCQDHFGEFLHHLPDIVDRMEERDTSAFEQNLQRFLSYTYDLLGEDTLRRWYASYV